MTLLLWAGVILIGGAGSVVRFLADGVVASAAGRDFPFGTLAINVSGAMILGFLTGLALGHDQALLAGTAAVPASNATLELSARPVRSPRTSAPDTLITMVP